MHGTQIFLGLTAISSAYLSGGWCGHVADLTAVQNVNILLQLMGSPATVLLGSNPPFPPTLFPPNKA